MAVVEVNIIDTLTSVESSQWYVKLLPIFTTVLGFSLGLFPGLISRIRSKNRTGHIFNQELVSLKISLDAQIKEVHRYIYEFSNEKIDPAKIESLILVLLHKFEILKSLDKIQLIKYFEKQDRKLASEYIGTLYQMFHVLERDTERLDRLYSEYQMKLDQFPNSFVDEINGLRILAVMERDRLGENYSKDILLTTLWDIAFSKNPDMNKNELMLFAAELPDKLLKNEVFANTNHVLYKPILEFSVSVQKIVNTYENEKKKFIGILKMSEQTFQDGLYTLKNSSLK